MLIFNYFEEYAIESDQISHFELSPDWAHNIESLIQDRFNTVSRYCAIKANSMLFQCCVPSGSPIPEPRFTELLKPYIFFKFIFIFFHPLKSCEEFLTVTFL